MHQIVSLTPSGVRLFPHMHHQSTFLASNRNAISRYSISNQQRFLCISNTSLFGHVRDSKRSSHAPRQRQTLSFRNNQNEFFFDIHHSPEIRVEPVIICRLHSLHLTTVLPPLCLFPRSLSWSVGLPPLNMVLNGMHGKLHNH